MKIKTIVKEISPKQKMIENLYSWKSFYQNKCNTGEKTHDGWDVKDSRVNMFYDWMYYRGNPFAYHYKEEGSYNRIETSNDKYDAQAAFSIDVEIARFNEQKNNRRK